MYAIEVMSSDMSNCVYVYMLFIISNLVAAENFN